MAHFEMINSSVLGHTSMVRLLRLKLFKLGDGVDYGQNQYFHRINKFSNIIYRRHYR
ncbi:hypothetical protein CJ030_MR3G026195 [Morella rubra]|uniref:Uncharacterized protein n=1 Tax=Morella rubra TaxID=262757 RepID=A0A6A1VZS3_9ROSI|nr:hypothetical protein CJ030_MR3G026195 [Morella rubra]